MVITIYLLGLFLPTQLGIHLWPAWSYLQGLRLDYLSPTIHLTDVLLVLLFLLNRKKLLLLFLKHHQVFLFLLLLIIFNLFVSLLPIHTFISWIRTLLLFNFAFSVSLLKPSQLKIFLTSLAISTLIISLLGIAQFLYQGSLDGLFYYLGERHFTLTTPDIAKSTLFGRLLLRPYGSFSHPNSLAGYLLVVILLFLTQPNLSLKKIHLTTLALALTTLFLTLSRSALLTLIILLPLLHPRLKKTIYYFLPLTLIILLTLSSLLPLPIPTAAPSLQGRLFLAQSSQQIILQSPHGVGLGNFLPALSNLHPNLDSRLLQPVHNLYLLPISEIGLIPLLLLFLILKKRLTPTPPLSLPFLSILLTGTLDHYWLTLPQNQLLLFFILGLMYNPKHANSDHPHRRRQSR